jgi:predicted heme/steroid binding protein
VTKNIVIATFASAILGLTMIGGAVYWQLQSAIGGTDAGAASAPALASVPGDGTFTLEELAQYDGKDGNQCLVAVAGDVYLIEGFDLWQNGEHTPSGGRARCGLDLTKVMDEESPHGRSKLPLLKKVGTLQEGTSE